MHVLNNSRSAGNNLHIELDLHLGTTDKHPWLFHQSLNLPGVPASFYFRINVRFDIGAWSINRLEHEVFRNLYKTDKQGTHGLLSFCLTCGYGHRGPGDRPPSGTPVIRAIAFKLAFLVRRLYAPDLLSAATVCAVRARRSK